MSGDCVPASGESLAKHKNAYETVQELQEIEGLGATFFLNNDSNENYDYINKNFASMLDEFLSNESYGRQNNFDESERLEMLKDSGAMVLSVTGDGTDSKIKLEKLTKSGIFAPIEDNYICENIGIIHSKNDKSDIDSEDVIAEVGKPDNVFEGFNGRKTIIAASGLDYPVSHVKKTLVIVIWDWMLASRSLKHLILKTAQRCFLRLMMLKISVHIT